MTGIGSIRFQTANAERIRDLALSRSVATVDHDEAMNGAAQSDMVRLAGRNQQQESESVPLSVYLSRAAQFRSQLKSKRSEESKRSDCPIEQARAESSTGANAPLNWLVADQFGGQAEFAPTATDILPGGEEEPSFSEPAAAFTAQPRVASTSGSLLADEWLLSPCA